MSIMHYKHTYNALWCTCGYKNSNIYDALLQLSQLIIYLKCTYHYKALGMLRSAYNNNLVDKH